MSLRVVVAPDSFKGSIDAADAAAAFAAGWASVRPQDTLTRVPLADGGEGTLDALGAGLGPDSRRSATVTGPDGAPVEAQWLLRPDGTAVVELARAAGLPQMGALDALGATTAGVGELLALAVADPATERIVLTLGGSATTDGGTGALDALGATTAGVGELLALAVADPATERIVLTLGGSATTDGGTGALRALGARFLDVDGAELPPGGGALARLASIDLSGLLPGPPGGLECLVDVTNPLLGGRGAAAVFGPQKGADPDDVAALDAALTRLSEVLAATAPHPVDRDTPGAGAAGGTAYGLLSCWPGRMVGGSRAVAEAVGLPAALADADLVVTGEGRFDEQSVDGKVVGNVLELAAAAGTPVVVVAGSVGAAPAPPAVAAVSLTDLAGSAEAAMAEPGRWLEAAGATAARDATVLAATARS